MSSSPLVRARISYLALFALLAVCLSVGGPSLASGASSLSRKVEHAVSLSKRALTVAKRADRHASAAIAAEPIRVHKQMFVSGKGTTSVTLFKFRSITFTARCASQKNAPPAAASIDAKSTAPAPTGPTYPNGFLVSQNNGGQSIYGGDSVSILTAPQGSSETFTLYTNPNGKQHAISGQVTVGALKEPDSPVGGGTCFFSGLFTRLQ